MTHARTALERVVKLTPKESVSWLTFADFERAHGNGVEAARELLQRAIATVRSDSLAAIQSHWIAFERLHGDARSLLHATDIRCVCVFLILNLREFSFFIVSDGCVCARVCVFFG